MQPSISSTVHCINPNCPKPAGQPWGNRFCQSCGAPIQLNRRYIPLKCLGTGGFSTLYTVWDLKSQIEKVLKVLVEPSPKALELFEQEAQVLAHIRHPGIPRVEANGYFVLTKRDATTSPLPCLVMEKIHGPTLQEILDQNPQGCPEAWVMSWLHQALEILRELHNHQIIHRDLKPSNLMLRSAPQFSLDGDQIQHSQLVMIDFGGAKQMGLLPHGDREPTPRSTTRLVSPGYSPPEQIIGAAVGPPADFYALGRTGIHLLTGQFPAELEDPVTAELIWQQRTTVSRGLGDILDAMVQNDQRLRPQTATEIQTALFRVDRFKRYPRRQMSFSDGCIDLIKSSLIALDQGLNHSLLTIGSGVLYLFQSTFTTLWESILGGLGGITGAVMGLTLAYWTVVGDILANWFAQQLPIWFPGLGMKLGAELLVLGLAGIGTAVGLTDAGGFDQHRRYGMAAFMGMVGYLVGSVTWQLAKPLNLIPLWQDLGGLTALCPGLAVAILTLGLGLSSHKSVHVVVAGVGTVYLFNLLGSYQLIPQELLTFPTVGIRPDWQEFWWNLGFIGLLGVITGLWLGVSHYLIIPLLRGLGWR
ncbi:MAG: serine/threonine-protein kinase [Microcoleaceae cyanobacterium]